LLQINDVDLNQASNDTAVCASAAKAHSEAPKRSELPVANAYRAYK
jgi:hypothetical protein